VKKFEAALRTAGKSADFKIYPAPGTRSPTRTIPGEGTARRGQGRLAADGCLFDRYLKARVPPGKEGLMRTYEVAAGILWNGSQVLIARGRAAIIRGPVGFPAAKRHPGETIEAA